jgi:hydrogenase maturation protein HypF
MSESAPTLDRTLPGPLRVQVDPPIASCERIRIEIQGAVQGVGFRPFVYRLANDMGLAGWVRNNAGGVVTEVEGDSRILEVFLRRVRAEAPPLSRISSLQSVVVAANGAPGFAIAASDRCGSKSALVLPDMATCAECLADVLDPNNRRYRYPFTNCTNCGPRFSIIEDVPYDRATTTMRSFTMCDLCRREYEDPGGRRFHAQPNACPSCGPRLTFTDGRDDCLSGDSALRAAEEAIAAGQVVAIKGLGGFHLVVDAANAGAVRRLHSRKRRQMKPFAIMARDVAAVRRLCRVSEAEEILLTSAESPIVLLRRRARPLGGSRVAHEVAPGNPYLGVMLPYTPLHHLLLGDLDFPIVATSGNISEEPICIDNDEAMRRLRDVADVFLLHDRPITRQIDDSVAQVVLGQPMVLRRSRGYAPLPVRLAGPPEPRVGEYAIGVGAHLKSTVALAIGNDVFLSQHIGDLETPESVAAFNRTLVDLPRLYDVEPTAVACDAHPDYVSTRRAAKLNLPRTSVQHHYGHVLSCMAEHGVDGPALGIAWDGTGYGDDGTIWGGEFLAIDTDLSFTRTAHLRTFSLPGGESAVREPRRSALGMLHEIFGEEDSFEWGTLRWCPAVAAFSSADLRILERSLARGLNAPRTSSAGRLFDGLAAILGLRQKTDFEGQAAMDLEFAIDRASDSGNYGVTLNLTDGSVVVDWEPMLRSVLTEVRNATPPGVIAARIHNTLVEMILSVAEYHGRSRVVLSGGCFQNRYLLERSVQRLRRAGHEVFWNQTVPTNDGGIALGQVMALRAVPNVQRDGTEYESPVSVAD